MLGHLLPERSYDSALQNESIKELIKRRLKERFIRPLEFLIKDGGDKSGDDYFAVGFAIMAIASLMIETLACFRNGQWTTHDQKCDLR